MKTIFLILSSLLLLSGCNDNNNTTTQPRFTVEHELTITDNHNNLMWIDDYTGDACTVCVGCVFPESAVSFCENLNFLGFNDWRAPTTPELSSLMTGIVEERLTLHYAVVGCAANISTTDYIATTNRADAGSIIEGFDKGGIRCVRNK